MILTTIDKNDAEAGRAFVKAYVEDIHEATTSTAHGHVPEAGEAPAHQHEPAEKH